MSKSSCLAFSCFHFPCYFTCSKRVETEVIDVALQAKTMDKLSNVSLEKKPKALPAIVEGEDLLTWCQRVTADYPSVKITDFT